MDLVFVPVGAGPTIGGEQAASIAGQLQAKWVVPMHYRTERVSFLESADEFLDQMQHVELLTSASFDTAELPGDTPLAVVPAAP